MLKGGVFSCITLWVLNLHWKHLTVIEGRPAVVAKKQTTAFYQHLHRHDKHNSSFRAQHSEDL